MSTAAPTTIPPTTAAPTTLGSTTAAPTTAAPTTVAPTTVAPTTAVPTTVLPTTTPPTFLTTPPPIDIGCGPIDVVITLFNSFHYFPPAARDTTLDSWHEAGAVEITIGVEGEQLNQWIEADAITITISTEGEFIPGVTVSDGVIDIMIELESYGLVLTDSRLNWVKWSKIGYLDFTIDESNVAGQRPLDWKGSVYGLKKLNDTIVAYGQNGVTILKASGVSYGMQTIYRVGVMGQGGFCGTEFEHYFVDTVGQMWKLSAKGLEKLDYSEYLFGMTQMTMSYDVNTGLIYICDGIKGYVYSSRSGSFGEGPVNITGLGSRTGNLYVGAPAAIVTPRFEICTDLYDFGTRKAKTVYSIEVGSNLTDNLQVSVDYRVSYKGDLRQIGWFLVNPNGFAYPKCYGVEFRFHLRSRIYEQFEIDYLKIGGMIHDFSYLDTTARESQRISAEGD